MTSRQSLGAADHGTRSPAPSVPAIVFLFWLLVTPLLLANRMLNADGDLPRHLRHGETILATGDVIRLEPFTYTRPGIEFVGMEVGSQLLYTWVHRVAGLAGVELAASAIIAAAFALLAAFLIRRGTDPLLGFLTAMAAAMVGMLHWVARPHVVSYVFIVLLLAMLERERPPKWWQYALLFLIWTNLHGGWVFGGLLCGIYMVGWFLEARLPHAPPYAMARARNALLGGLVAAAACFVNPYGAKLPAHIVYHFKERFLLDNTNEFRSPDFHMIGPKFFLAALLVLLFAFAITRERPRLPRLLLIVAGVYFALISQRNITVFALTALPVAALSFDAAWRRLPDPRGLRAGFARASAAASTWPWVGVGTLLALVLALRHGRVGGVEVVPDRFDPQIFPVALVEQARAERLEGRIFHEFTWGGYLLYAWPEQKIFIDGGTDVLGPDLMRTHMEITRLQPGWREHLAGWQVDWALLAPRTPLASQLAHEPGWRLDRCDRTAALFHHDGATAASDSLAPQRLGVCADTARTDTARAGR
ncbi:MAG TPA: hypothetical protein VFY20_01050 [Gemmatimonadales bacterium]|nr:hypothetical protein [Gemmatimonadales bacterium]